MIVLAVIVFFVLGATAGWNAHAKKTIEYWTKKMLVRRTQYGIG